MCRSLDSFCYPLSDIYSIAKDWVTLSLGKCVTNNVPAMSQPLQIAGMHRLAPYFRAKPEWSLERQYDVLFLFGEIAYKADNQE